ncbi:hypothetical protein BGZ76_008368 [Entomortierella beljakovae]|nr:hypothetical protein BGZ76_008368 [Entomortierella beljakovae]
MASEVFLNKYMVDMNVRVGDQVAAKSLVQQPKFFEEGFQDKEFVISEQMMKSWELLNGESGTSIKGCLSGLKGVGKSYITWFLAAKAYAHG